MGQRVPVEQAPPGAAPAQAGGGGDVQELISGVLGGLDILVQMVGQTDQEAGQMLAEGTRLVQQGLARLQGGAQPQQQAAPAGQPTVGGPGAQPLGPAPQ